MGLLKSYKPMQAKTSRMITFVTGAFLIGWGGFAAIQNLPLLWDKLGVPINRLMDPTIAHADGWSADILIMRTPVNPAFLVAVVGVLAGLLWWHRFLNTERWAEMLIEMETEMRKVSWPTPSDAWQSTLVVTGCTVVLVVMIFVYDFVIHGFMSLFAKGL